MVQNKRSTISSDASIEEVQALAALKILINASRSAARMKVQFDGLEHWVEPEVRGRLKKHGLLRPNGRLTRKGRARLQRAIEIITA